MAVRVSAAGAHGGVHAARFVCFLQVELVGSDVQRSLQCRRDVKRYINLQNLVATSDAAKDGTVDQTTTTRVVEIEDATNAKLIGEA